MESRVRLDLAEVALQLEGITPTPQDKQKAATLLELSKRIRISLRNYQNLITELTQAGMLERLTPKSQAAIFQLYPMPFPKPPCLEEARSDLNGSKAKH